MRFPPSLPRTALLLCLCLGLPALPLKAQETSPPTAAAADATPTDGSDAADLPQAEFADARAVVEHYYARISEKDYAGAYALWADEGRASQQSPEEFRAGFADTEGVEVFTRAPERIEGAAGSLYATIPVRIEARHADGSLARFAGSYIVQRVNDVPGTDTARLHWQLHSAELAPQD